MLYEITTLWTTVFQFDHGEKYKGLELHRLSYSSSSVQFAHQSNDNPDNKIHGANMGPILGRLDPDGSHAGPMNFAIWEPI